MDRLGQLWHHNNLNSAPISFFSNLVYLDSAEGSLQTATACTRALNNGACWGIIRSLRQGIATAELHQKITNFSSDESAVPRCVLINFAKLRTLACRCNWRVFLEQHLWEAIPFPRTCLKLNWCNLWTVQHPILTRNLLTSKNAPRQPDNKSLLYNLPKNFMAKQKMSKSQVNLQLREALRAAFTLQNSWNSSKAAGADWCIHCC